MFYCFLECHFVGTAQKRLVVVAAFALEITQILELVLLHSSSGIDQKNSGVVAPVAVELI